MDPIKAKIQELMPDVMLSANPAKWTITIAVVLRAIEKKYRGDGFALMSSNGWLSMRGKAHCRWDLEKDYDQQSEETRTFIGKLLGVK